MKYKIRNKTTGKFLGGNRYYPRWFQWTNRGITWGSRPKLKELKSNLEAMGGYKEGDLDDLEIVEYELVETQTHPLR